jgi:hypothetical protein
MLYTLVFKNTYNVNNLVAASPHSNLIIFYHCSMASQRFGVTCFGKGLQIAALFPRHNHNDDHADGRCRHEHALMERVEARVRPASCHVQVGFQ